MQVASPAEIYERPNSRWVADFIGEVNLFEGRLGSDRTSVEGTPVGKLRAATAIDAEGGAAVCIAIRPERMHMTREPPAGYQETRQDAQQQDGQENCFAGTIVDIGYLGDLSIYKVRIADGSTVKAAIVNSGPLIAHALGRNEPVWLTFSPEAAIALLR